jgi:flagellar hook-length control protein FliK
VLAWKLLISYSDEPEMNMADFMTVLAASQKHAPTGPQGRALASLLPGDVFENVLSAQMGAAADGEDLSLPLVLSDQLLAQARPAAKKPMSSAVDTDLSASLPSTALPSTALPGAPLPSTSLPGMLPSGAPQPGEPLPGTPLDPSNAQILVNPAESGEATAKPVPTAVAKDPSAPLSSVALPIAPPEMTREQVSVKPADSGEATAKPVLPGIRPLLEAAATPAARAGGAGQELPQGDRQPQASAANGAGTVAVAGTLLPQVAVEAPTQAALGNDLSGLGATRHVGHFEQLARAPETRLQAAVDAPVRSQGFAAEFSEKIVWLVGRQSQVADLSLNPPQLGTLEVRLSLSGNEAGAQFYSPNAVVRDAIEAAMPKLRELMAQAGIALGDAQVHDQAFAQREAGGGTRASGEVASGEASASLVPVAVRTGVGLVDLYA